MAALSALRTDLLDRLNDSGNRVISAAQATRFINEAQQEWCNRTEELRVEKAFPVVAYQFDYAAPTDMNKLLFAWWGPTRVPLEIVNQGEFMQMGGYEHVARGVPCAVLVEGVGGSGQRLRLYPSPSATSASNTLSGAHNTTVATLLLTSANAFRTSSGWVQLNDAELVLYQNTSSTQLLLCRRGMGGSTAASYTGTESVKQCDVHIVYTRQPAALSADADVPEISLRWHRNLVYGAQAIALRLDRRDGEAGEAERRWQDLLKEGEREVRRGLGGSPARILESGY